MKPETLKTLRREEVHDFIRERLTFPVLSESHSCTAVPSLFNKQHHRFSIATDPAKRSLNLLILDRFSDLGIYNYTTYLYLDFHEGTPTLNLQYREETKSRTIELPGMDTVEIIYEIFRYTIFSDKPEKK